MKTSFAFAAIATALFASAAVLAPTAAAEPTPDPVDTIQDLRDQGYSITIDRVGTAPLPDCIVTSIRNPHEEWSTRRDNDGDLVSTLISKTIVVSLSC